MTTRRVYRLHHLPHLAGLLCTILILAVAGVRAASPPAPPSSGRLAPISQGGSSEAIEGPASTGPLLSYQGRLINPNTGNPLSGTFQMTFRLWDAATGGTSALWTETKMNVQVSNGLFTTLLGESTALNLAAFDGRDLWLGVQVGSDAEATPRIPVAYAPYAIRSNLAGKAADADKLGGSLPSSYRDAANLTGGTLSTARYSAVADLSEEGMLGNASGDIAMNNGSTQATLNADMLDNRHSVDFATAGHNHDPAYVNDDWGEVGNSDVPVGALSPDRISGTAWTSTNHGWGSGMDADLLDGQHAAAFSGAGHNHLGEYWPLGTNSNGLALEGTVAWANSLLKATNYSNGPSIWGINYGSGNGVRGQGAGDSMGVYGQAENAAGVAGRSSGSDGVAGVSSAAGKSGVAGTHEGSGFGVYGVSENGQGVYGKDGGSNPDDSWAVWSEGDMRANGDLSVALTLYVGGLATFGGGKSGFVVDIAQNDDMEPLMPGDVVSISGAGPPVVGEIPVVKVRRATDATAAGVVGVVDGRFTRETSQRTSAAEGAAPEKVQTTVEPVAVDPGQYLTVVTLGAYKAIKVDAVNGPIQPGDLLVASPNPGHAMRSIEPAPGTIIGKSLGSLAGGTGVVPVLVTLQ